MANYPSSVPTFTTKVDDVDSVQAGHINAVQDEITALASGQLNGLAHVVKPEADGTRDLGTSSLRWRDVFLTRLLKIAGVTVTVDTPPVDVAQTWNAGAVTFTGIKVAITDTASAAASKLLDLLVGGSSKLSVDKDGDIKPRGVDYTWPAGLPLTNQVLKATDGTGTLVWAAGGAKPFLVFTAQGNQPPASAFATPDSRNAHPVLDFDPATDESAMFGGVLSPDYSGSGLTVEIFWMATSAVSGAVVWEVAFERHQDDVDDLDADSFATAKSVTTTTASASGEVKKSTLIFANGAEIDSLAAGESFRLKVTRDADNGADTMTGDAELLRVVVRES